MREDLGRSRVHFEPIGKDFDEHFWRLCQSAGIMKGGNQYTTQLAMLCSYIMIRRVKVTPFLYANEQLLLPESDSYGKKESSVLICIKQSYGKTLMFQLSIPASIGGGTLLWWRSVSIIKSSKLGAGNGGDASVGIIGGYGIAAS